MMSETKPTHTSGALRAAEILGTEFKASPELRLRVLAAADVISRETGDLQMLEALERIVDCIASEQPGLARRVAQIAIHKARDGSR